MSFPTQRDVTRMLLDWSNGDSEALQKLTPLIYDELHRLAARYMRRERSGHTLQTTALVNEAYLRLFDQKQVRWQNRTHFLAIAAKLMRRILIDHARSHKYAKRGGGIRMVTLDEAAVISGERAAELVALDDALNLLAQRDSRKSQVVEMRFFGGLSVEETAEALQISPNTVIRDWTMAKAWLKKEMKAHH